MADVSGALEPYKAQIAASIAQSEARISKVVGALDLDVVAYNIPGRVIPSLGFVGYAPTGWLILLTFDAANENLLETLGAPLERTVTHEVNHILRWRGPGYGKTLGEALVSEGLAGQFTKQLHDNPPEPWEQPKEADLEALEDVIAGWSDGYDHGAWFFGSGTYPAWLGYRLGYRIVAAHIKATGQTALDLTDEPAEAFLATAQRRLS